MNGYFRTIRIWAQRIKTDGESFDPLFHEAVSAKGDRYQELVSQELYAGYKHGDQVIIKVKV